jgi:hexosaminidase
MFRLRAALPLLIAALPVCTAAGQSLKLIPNPREVRPASGVAASIPLPAGVRIACASCSTDLEDRFAADDLTQELAGRQIATNSAAAYTLQLVHRPDASFTAEMKPEGYTISTAASTLTVTAVTDEGLFYGIQTLKQMIVGGGSQATLQTATIRDWPAMTYRGLSDDVSRGPVPTLDFQKKLIRTLAAYKINLYSPYFEHTQQYASNPLPAPPGGSISAEDARALVAFARQYHVLVVPEQEAFAHLHHNLTWESYADLAETPHGDVLAPAQPGSLKLIGQMFTELAALYPGPFLHIGADETVDLGLGQTKADVDARTLGPVYLDFVQKIDTTLAPLHRRLLFWADIAQEVTKTQPNLLKDLPASFKKDTIAIAWQYNPEPRGFARFLTPLTSAGFETWVSPGINNWSRVWPNGNLALPNIQGFIRDGQSMGATGALNTIWYDDGEALANNNWYGILFGAAASWQAGESSIPQFQNAYAQVFHGDLTGALNEAQIELMAAHALLRDQAKTGDASDGLFWIDPMSKDGQNYAAKLRPFTHDLRLHAERALTLIAQARAAGPLREPDAIDALELGARRIDFIGLKFQLADEIATGYQRALAAATSPDKKLHATTGRELTDINGVNGRIQDIIDTYALLRDMYEAQWLKSNRPYFLRVNLEHFDYAIALWYAKGDKVRTAQRQFGDLKTLPSASDLGIPAPPR